MITGTMRSFVLRTIPQLRGSDLQPRQSPFAKLSASSRDDHSHGAEQWNDRLRTVADAIAEDPEAAAYLYAFN
jgi:hypothetical protein